MYDFFKRIPPNGIPEFSMFSGTHIIAIIIMIIIVITATYFFMKIKQGKTENVIRYFIGIIMLLSNITIFLYAYNNHLNWYHYVPEATCGWAVYFGAFTMLTKNRTMFVLTLYWSYGAILTMIGPNVLEGPDRYNFYQFQLRHILIIIVPIYMMIVHKYKIQKQDFKIYFFITLVMAIIGGIVSLVVNEPDSLNMFYMVKPGMNGTPLSWIYDKNYYIYVVVWLSFAILLGYIYGLLMMRLSKYFNTDDKYE